MSMAITRRTALGLALLGILSATSLEAAPPWSALFPFSRVEADPKKDYKLTEQNGPWLILCATFSGEYAPADAKELVMELRRDFQLEAYTHAQTYDFTQAEEGLSISRYSTPDKLRRRKAHYQQNVRREEVAVMVGNFPAVDDPTLQSTLDKIKRAKPKCLNVKDGNDTSFSLAGYRSSLTQAVSSRLTKNGVKAEPPGLMAIAFATPNPLVPKEAVTGPASDRLVLDMNQEVEFSLLKCPKKYTVRIATFRGGTTIDQREIHDTLKSGKPVNADRLVKAAENANKLTTWLRNQGIEAYEFHDRAESIVTVGSFDSIGTPRPDGKTEMDPAVLSVIKNFGPEQQAVVGKEGAMAALKPRLIQGIPCDAQPWPVVVPRPSLGAVYGGGMFR